jgi:poly(beta-D-mannuronate) lyase
MNQTLFHQSSIFFMKLIEWALRGKIEDTDNISGEFCCGTRAVSVPAKGVSFARERAEGTGGEFNISMNPKLRRVWLIAFEAAVLSIGWAQDTTANPPLDNPTAAQTSSKAPDMAKPDLVDSIAVLQSRINAAVPGDLITVKDGTYELGATLNIRCRGTSERPITIAAETVGGVEIIGAFGFKAGMPAEHVVISGFKFKHVAGKASIAEGTRFVRFTRNLFQCSGEGHDLTVVGDDAQIDRNEFGPKKSSGTMIAVSGTGNQVARRLWIHHNYFHDFDHDGSNGAEMIRLGLLSAHRLSVGESIIEHNLFAHCRGVNDLISNRSSRNTFRYNTFLDSPSAHLTVRQGNDCSIYGNIFRNTEGIRLYGDRHQVFSNYLENNYVGIAIGNGTVEFSDIGDAASPNGHDRPDGCVITFNTLVDNNTHYQMSRRPADSLGATNTIFANNVLEGGAVAAKIDGPNLGAVWSGNLAWNITKLRDLPPEEQILADPRLIADLNGIKRPGADSPVLEAATGSFPSVIVDLDGQLRPEKKSCGADELGTDSVRANLLSIADVGPQSYSNITSHVTENPEAGTPPAP